MNKVNTNKETYQTSRTGTMSTSQRGRVATPSSAVDSPKVKSKKTLLQRVLTICSVIALWLFLFLGGYLVAERYLETSQQYVNQQMDELKRQHGEVVAGLSSLQEAMQASTAEITEVQQELGYIKEELEMTGETMTGSDQTKQALQERMSELDLRLGELRNQLKKLEDAVRAY